jgi:hypothetical protein
MTRFGDQFMSMDRSTLHRPLLTAAIVMMSSLCALAQPPPRVRGTIEKVEGMY